MASMSLYPPIVDSSMPAFNANEPCTIYYSLSKFNSTIDIKSIHISIMYQKEGTNPVNKTDDITDIDKKNHRFRSSGIIVLNQNLNPVQGETNLYSININPKDLINGWNKGSIYKVQLRFSSVPYDSSVPMESWLNKNANNFSEWSTVCAIKPIGQTKIIIPVFDYDSTIADSAVNDTTERTVFSTTLDFHGSYTCETANERLYSYRVMLYDNLHSLIEDSGVLYANNYYDSGQFKYLFKTELDNENNYYLRFSYTTEHGYEKVLNDFNFMVSATLIDRPSFTILTVDNDIEGLLKEETSLGIEEDEGRIGIKIIDEQGLNFSGNICIRRTDSKSNFTKWEDIKIITFKQANVNEIEIFYDYTIESGVWYKYGLQTMTINGVGEIVRSQMYEMEDYIIRNFNYSYLLGYGGVQLKLKYNNDMNNYKINLSEGKIDTIGGIYPFITRNGNTNYRTFPITGLISFNMDENNIFTNENEVYNDNTHEKVIVDKYNQYNVNNNITSQYDYTYERLFREKVLKFLHDGKPKLFKSPTEGNVIIRLMDINESPQQDLGRLIYSFSATGHEIAEATLENYEKYKFYEVGEPVENFATYDTKIGQIIGDFSFGENICERIWKKYDSQGQNYAGYTIKLGNIKYLRIEINSQPFRVKNNSKTKDSSVNSDYTVGNNINYNNSIITIYGNRQVYEFDSLLSFTKNDYIAFLGPDDESDTRITINATIDFVYDIVKDVYVPKKIKSQTISNGIGQYYENTTVGTSIYNTIFYKYYINWEEKFCKLSSLTGIEIEAIPGAVFGIKDEKDSELEEHDIGFTGILRLNQLSNIKELKFMGFRQPDGSLKDEDLSCDVMVNYSYILTKGEYLKDG